MVAARVRSLVSLLYELLLLQAQAAVQELSAGQSLMMEHTDLWVIYFFLTICQYLSAEYLSFHFSKINAKKCWFFALFCFPYCTTNIAIHDPQTYVHTSREFFCMVAPLVFKCWEDFLTNWRHEPVSHTIIRSPASWQSPLVLSLWWQKRQEETELHRSCEWHAVGWAKLRGECRPCS